MSGSDAASAGDVEAFGYRQELKRSLSAFDLLVYASQRTHRKLRDVAIWVVETGLDPSAITTNNHAHE